jgi:hypothetical protein
VVVDVASDIYLLMQFFVSPCSVQLEPVCSHGCTITFFVMFSVLLCIS